MNWIEFLMILAAMVFSLAYLPALVFLCVRMATHAYYSTMIETLSEAQHKSLCKMMNPTKEK